MCQSPIIAPAQPNLFLSGEPLPESFISEGSYLSEGSVPTSQSSTSLKESPLLARRRAASDAFQNRKHKKTNLSERLISDCPWL